MTDPAPEPRNTVHASIRVALEDVTAEQAAEFFERVARQDIEVCLRDGLTYAASVEAVHGLDFGRRVGTVAGIVGQETGA